MDFYKTENAYIFTVHPFLGSIMFTQPKICAVLGILFFHKYSIACSVTNCSKEIALIGANLDDGGFLFSGTKTGTVFLATDPDYRIPFCGFIQSWTAYFIANGIIRFQVWRPRKGMTYHLVGQTFYRVQSITKSRRKIVIVDQSKPLVQPGDFIGWQYQTKELIPFRKSSVIARGRGFWQLDRIRIGAPVDWGTGTFLHSRKYAITATVQKDSAPFFVKTSKLYISTLSVNDTTPGNYSLYTLTVKDQDRESHPLHVTMETKSLFFGFNNQTHSVYTLRSLQPGRHQLKFKVTDFCGKFSSASILINVDRENQNEEIQNVKNQTLAAEDDELIWGKPAIVWRVALPMCISLTVLTFCCLCSAACVRWRTEAIHVKTEPNPKIHSSLVI